MASRDRYPCECRDVIIQNCVMHLSESVSKLHRKQKADIPSK